MDRVVELFGKGGPVMYAIAASSVVALSIFLERLYVLRTSKVVPRALVVEVDELLKSGKRAEALARSKASHSAMGAVFEAVLRMNHAPLAAHKEAAEDAGRREAQRLERFVAGLGTIASMGPLLGLLGTVLGMIQVFQKVAEVGAGSPLEMADGIWQALLSTAFGLLIGIPALVMHRYLLSRVDRVVLDLEDAAAALIDRVHAGADNPEVRSEPS